MNADPKVAPMTSDNLAVLLRKRFPAEEWALLYEVRNATGFGANRAADAIAFGLWPSRGMPVIGFEFKVSRSDWLRELKDPSKADPILSYCDRWYVVTSEPAIIKPGELPVTWGHMAPCRGGLECVVEAKPLEPKPLDKAFVAAVCRAAQNHSPGEAAIRVAVAAAQREWEQSLARAEKSAIKSMEARCDQLQAAVDAFEKRAGIRITQYNGPEIADAVRLLTGRGFGVAGDVEHVAHRLTAIAADLTKLAKLPAMMKPLTSTEEPHS